MEFTETSAPLLELDLLRTLVAIAETGNFTAAANAVHRTPSAVSMQVKRVEEIIGRPVFKRDSRSVTATVEGELILEHGRRLLALNNNLVQQFLEPEIAGGVRLGIAESLAVRSMPNMLRNFGQTHCGVTVDVTIDQSATLRDQVRNDELDVALIACSFNKKLAKDHELLYREKLVWAGAKFGVAFEQNPLPISVWEEGCSWRAAAIESLESIGRDYRIAFMSAQSSGQTAAILADMAIAPIPLSSCTDEIIPLGKEQGLPELGEYGLVLILGKQPSKPVLAAAEYFRNSFEN